MTLQNDKQIKRRRALFGSLALLITIGLVAGVSTFASDSIRDFISRFQFGVYSGCPVVPTTIVS